MAKSPERLSTFTRREFVANALAASLAPTILAQTVPAAPSYDSVRGVNSLRAHAEARGLLIGAAVNTGMLRTDPLYPKVLAEQYNLAVAENAMKWAALRPAPDRFDFTESDALVAFAQSHSMKIRGHNFVWHEALPAWFASTVTRENALRLLSDHIQTVGRRYAGKVHSWDVVNEVLDAHSTRADLLRTNSPWFELLGPDYIGSAFRIAREADPHALLTINEYGVEYDSDVPKRNALLALLKRLRAERVPVDAVGLQSHLSAASPNKLGTGIRGFVDQAHALGLKVFITELDVNDDALASDDATACQAAVAETYRHYVSAMLQKPAVTAILTWGVTNKSTWLNTQPYHLARHPARKEQPLPFDAEYRPTAAFFALRDAIDSSA